MSVVMDTCCDLNMAMQSRPAKVDVSGPIVLYGAGQLGRWTLKAMRGAGLGDPVCFVDGNRAKWGEKIDGVSVCAPSMAPKGSLYVVTIYTGAAVREICRECGYRTCSFAAFYRAALLGKPEVAVPYGALDDPEEIRRHEQQIRLGYDVWADEQSRAEYVAQIRYRVSLEDPNTPSLPPSEIYFPPEQPLRSYECFVDVGAFDGDTAREFYRRTDGRIIAIEPDPKNVEKIRQRPYEWDIRIIEAAATNRDGMVCFDATGTAGSCVTSKGNAVRSVRLDTVLADEYPTRMKFDVEGSEPMALVGAAKTIRHCEPYLAVCLYHSPEHLWTIPLFLKALVPEYRLYLRRYSDDCWETVCYAVRE
jgi:FkbM family methyltransferase